MTTSAPARSAITLLLAALATGAPACSWRLSTSTARSRAPSVADPRVAPATVDGGNAARETLPDGDAVYPWGPLAQRCDRRPSKRPKASAGAPAAIAFQEGHPSPATTLVASPDGSLVATGGDRVVDLWDLSSGALRMSIPILGGAGRLSFSPDSDTLAVASDPAITLLDASRGEVLRRLPAPDGPVTALSWTRDGEAVVAACADGTLHAWNVHDGHDHARVSLERADGEMLRRALVAMSSTGLLDTEDITLPLLRLRRAGDLRTAPTSALEAAALIPRRGLLRDLWIRAFP